MSCQAVGEKGMHCSVCTNVSAYTDVCYSFINVKSTTPMTLVPVLKSKTGMNIAL